jgi:hypothetical protein
MNQILFIMKIQFSKLDKYIQASSVKYLRGFHRHDKEEQIGINIDSFNYYLTNWI